MCRSHVLSFRNDWSGPSTSENRSAPFRISPSGKNGIFFLALANKAAPGSPVYF
ncbi:hypothetical protein HMPREF0201_03729 [Cedecea davisae DSM 4568]|uniref:Uncharacterized protein n=1 Tax=Cedecea davisae DSM 4568 TaxID=566551 RepID=S3IKF4_9ENTR|nr:hypothetical protein HMPREF0201_03729 [Cedecea davisae DSM 4568]